MRPLAHFWRTAALTSSTLAVAAPAQEAPGLFERQHPLEGWQATTKSLSEKGIDVEIFYTLDLLSNVDGGVERDTALIGNLDLVLFADLEALLDWPHTRMLLYGIANHGEISPAVGDIQGVSNIEGPATVKLFEAWIEKDLFDRQASVLLGLYDVNSEFDVIPSAALFLNGSQGMGGELGNSGRNGPSTFPVTSVGARVDVQPDDSFYARAVAVDGVPGSPTDDKRTQIHFDDGDGLLLLAEVGYVNIPSDRLRGRTRRYADELPIEDRRYGFFGKFAIGIWQYTGTFTDFGGTSQRNASPGLYALAEQRVFYEADNPLQGLSLYARAGIADGRTDPIDGYLGGGVVYRGLFEGRNKDETGLGIAAAHFSSSFREAAGGPNAWEDWEIAFELTHRIRLAPWLSLQPDAQYVVNPGGDPALENATVIGLRALASF